MGILPGVANSQATVLDPSDTVPVGDAVATDCAVDVPHHVGGCSCRKPAPEIDNRFEEVGTKLAQLPKHAHTLLLHSRLTLKEKDAGHEEGAIQRTHFGTRLSRPQIGPYT